MRGPVLPTRLPARLPSLLVLLALLLATPGAAQDAPLELAVDALSWGYGPETWKDTEALPTGTATHAASLGSRLDLSLNITRDGAAPPADWTYEAMLLAGPATVDGLVTPDPDRPGAITVRFDVDGDDLPPAAPSLPDGTWTVRVEARGDDGFEGAGTTRVDAQRPRLTALPGLAVPESAVPGIDQFTASPTAWMPLAPLSGVQEFTLDAPAPRVVAWTRSPAGLLEDEPGWTLQDLSGTAVHDGTLRIDPATLGTGLHVVAAQGNGPAAAWLIPVGHALAVTDIDAPEPGTGGPVTYTVAGDVTPSTPAPLPALPDLPGAPGGTAYALEQGTLATSGDAVGLGASVLAQAPLVPSDEAAATAALDTTSLRASAEPAYVFLAFALDADGTYLGHAAFLRGVVPELTVDGLRVGQEADAVLALRHAESLRDAARGTPEPGLAFAAALTMDRDGDPLSSETVTVPARGTLLVDATVRPLQTGATAITAVVDSGDLSFTLRETVPVADEDAQAHGPTGAALLAAILGLLVLRKRQIRP